MGAGAGAKATSKPSGDDAGALAAEIDRRGLVRHGDAFSSRHKGVSWDKQAQTWRARLKHGGKTPKLGYFGTEAEAKARRDARCRELRPADHLREVPELERYQVVFSTSIIPY